MRRIIINFSTIVYLNYLIVFSDFCNSGKLKLIQTTTGNNANAPYYICQIQLIWISTIITHSFTIRLHSQEFQLCLICTESDNITIVKNFII